MSPVLPHPWKLKGLGKGTFFTPIKSFHTNKIKVMIVFSECSASPCSNHPHFQNRPEEETTCNAHNFHIIKLLMQSCLSLSALTDLGVHTHTFRNIHTHTHTRHVTEFTARLYQTWTWGHVRPKHIKSKSWGKEVFTPKAADGEVHTDTFLL